MRGLLSEHPELLVVLDNVWSLAAIQPLRDALPPGCRLIVTTRSREIAQGLGAGWVEVGLLSQAEALDLFDLRLGCVRPRLASADRPQDASEADRWAFDLAAGVGLHALGLDVALGVLRRYGDGAAGWRTTAERLLQEIRSGRFDRLRLGDNDPGHNVKAVMMFSYEALKGEAQARFRRLGAFALEADFTTEVAAAAWGCDAEQAFETLTDFAVAALLERREGGPGGSMGCCAPSPWHCCATQGRRSRRGSARPRLRRRHAPRRRRAALLRDVACLAATAPRVRMGAGERPRPGAGYRRNSANVQKQFGLAREGGDWSERALAASRRAQPPRRWRVPGGIAATG